MKIRPKFLVWVKTKMRGLEFKPASFSGFNTSIRFMSNSSIIKKTILNIMEMLPKSGTGAIRLTKLREELDGISRKAQDTTLIELQNEGKIILYKDDNTFKLTPADKAAAVMVAGNPRHLAILL